MKGPSSNTRRRWRLRAEGVGQDEIGGPGLAHRRIAGSLDRLGRFAQAEMHYKKAIGLAPKDYRVWNDAGYSYYLQGRWADAERSLKSAERLAPRSPGSRRTWAWCWQPRDARTPPCRS